MLDRYNREINYLRISVTDLCNYRCKYCMKEDGIVLNHHQEIISYEEIQRLVIFLAKKGINKIRISGGEPLVRKDIDRLFYLLKDVEGIKEKCLTTNGSLLDKHLTVLKECGFTTINISLDTLNEDKYYQITRRGNLKKVLQNIDLAIQNFAKVKINVVYIKGFNDDEIDQFIEFAKTKKVIVRFIELMPIGEAKNFNYSSLDEIINNHCDLVKIKDDGVSELYKTSDEQGLIGFIRPLSHTFCHRCNKLRLTSLGKIKPCLFSNEEIDVKGLSDDLLEEVFNKILQNKPINKENVQLTTRTMNEIGG